MKKLVFSLLALFSLVLYSSSVYAQCGATTNNAGTVDVGCAAFGTSTAIPSTAYKTFLVVNGVNYTVSTCGTGWDSQLTLRDNADTYKAYNDDNGPDCTGAAASLAWTADFTGTAKAYVHRYSCGSVWEGTSAVLKVRQNTTISNTTSTAAICTGGSKALTSTLGGTYSGNPTVTYSIVSGSGSISGSTYNHSGGAGSVTVRATVGVCNSDVTFNVVPQPDDPTTATKSPNLSAICTGTVVSASAPSGGTNTGLGCSFEYRFQDAGSGSWTAWGSTSSFTTSGVGVGTNAAKIQIRRGSCSSGCTNSPGTFQLTWDVQAQPALPTLNAKTPNVATVCAGTGVNATINAGTGGVGCSDVYQYRTRNLSNTWSAWTTYSSGANIATTAAMNRVEVQVQRAGCTAGTGCTGTAFSTIAAWDVTPQPIAPTLNAKTPNLAAICEGQTVSATINVGSGGVGCSDTYEYRRRTTANAYEPWAAYVSASSIPTTGYNLVEIRVARENCTALSGCNSTGYTTIASWTVNPQPSNPTLNVKTPNSAAVCEGQNVSATINAGTGGVGCSDVYEYRTRDLSNIWSAWAAYTSGASLATSGTNRVEIRVQRGSCSAGTGCSATSPATIASWDVYPQGSITITPSQTVCSGTGVLLSATVTGGSGADNYQWQVFNAGVWNNVGVNSDNYTTPVLSSTTQYRCVLSSTVPGCDADTSAVTTLTVVPNPTISIGTAQTICSGGSVTLSSSVSGGTGTLTYQWQYFDGIAWQNTGGNTATLATGALAASTDFRCVYSATGLGCSPATSNTVTITVLPDPTVSIVGSTTFCGSGSTTLTAVGSGGTGTLTYQWQESTDSLAWSDVGTNSSSHATGTVSTTTFFRTKYFATGIGCDTAISNVVKVTIQPTIANNIVSPTYQKFCASGTPTLIVGGVPTGGTGTYTYLWEQSVNSGATWTPASGLNGGVDYQPPFATSTIWYKRTVTSGVCSDDNNLSIVNVLTLPSFVSVSHTDVSCFGGNDGTISASGSSANGGVLYSLDGGPFQTSPFTGLTAGSYTITIRDDSACSVTYPSQVVVSEPTQLSATIVATADASCANVFDGSLTGFASGGVAPYQYSLNGGPFQISPTFSNIAAGFYTFTAIDDKGCLASDTVTINNQYAVSATLDSIKNVSCFGGNDGEIYVTLSGGVMPYSYSINGVTYQAVPVFTGLTANNYVVTLRDAKGCSAFLNAGVTQPGLLSVLIDSVVNSLCNGGSTGGIYITTAGGTAPYTYLWSNGSGSEDITNVPANSYNVTVTDSKGCTAVGGASISQPLPLSAYVASYRDVLCNGDSTGFVDISVAGGTSPYSFNWSNGASTEDILNVPVGTYSVTVTDANACVQVVSQTIGEPALLSSSFTSVNILCNGGANGSVDLTVSGGVTPYTYLWSNGQTTEDISGLLAGLYTVVVTDGNGCTTSNLVNITEAPALTLSVSTVNVLCNGDSGTASLAVSGGTGAYSYAWSNGASTSSISDVAGTYSVTVTDGNGCTKVTSVTITEPTAIVVNATVVNVNCYGGNTGSVSITVGGGVFPYNYSWSNGVLTQNINGLTGGTYTVTVSDANGCTVEESYTVVAPASGLQTVMSGTDLNCNGDGNGSASVSVSGGTAPYSYGWSTFANTSSISGLNGGTYFVTVTDVNGCSARDSVVINEPAAIQISSSVVNVLCNGDSGTASLAVSGGTGAYSYAWSNGASTSSISDVAGTYSVTVTDGNGCTKVTSVTITEPTAIVVNATVVNVNCYGGNTGSVSITVGGGVFPYNYSWSNGVLTQNINGLTGGTYTVTVSDANGCTVEESYTVVAPASGLQTVMSGTDLNCNGDGNGSASVSVSGGTAPYSYGWSTFANTSSISGLNGGTYFVTVTDVNGCSARDSVVINEPAAIQISSSVVNVLCNGDSGTASLAVSGGTGAYSYAWSNGASTSSISDVAGTYSVTVTDGNGCTKVTSVTITEPTAIVVNATVVNVNCYGGNTGSVSITVGGGVFPYSYSWSNGALTQNINGLTGGTYTVTVSDANGCTVEESYTVVAPASGLQTVMGGTDLNCNGDGNGSASVSVSGGTAPYSYGWSTFANTSSISGLNGGTYFVTVTDVNGCSARDSVVINEPAAIQISSSVVNVLCNGDSGTASLTVSGGTGAYSYAWSNGALTSSISDVAGTYSVTVTDGNGCTKVTSVTITQPAVALNIVGSQTDVTCNGLANGTINVNVVGGTVPYSYLWSNGAIVNSLTGLGAGTYTVTVTDANGCTLAASYTINEPSALVTGISGTDVSCAGANDGTVDFSVSGGTAPYTYSWNTFANTEDLNGVGGGTYIVVVTDANGCTARESITIAEPQPLVITLDSLTNVNCNGGANGAINLTTTGGTTPYTFAWSNGAATEDVFGLQVGTYTVTVTDFNNCSVVSSFTITQPAPIQVSGVVKDVSCSGASDGTISQSIVGGVQPYTFAWNNGASTQDLAGLGGGTYTFTVTDFNGCTVTASYTVAEPQPLAATISKVDVDCPGAANGSATVSVTGGTLPYTYFWSNFTLSSSINAVSGGKYYVIVKDKNNCELRDSVVIAEPQPIVITPTVTNVACNNGNSGAISVTVSGGTPAYAYAWSNGGTTASISGLTAGSYTLTVTDANNCTQEITVTVTQPVVLALTGVAVDALCNGASNGKVDITVVGGTIPYTFSWSNGSALEDLNNVPAGTYDVTVTDLAGCTATDSYVVAEPSAIVSLVTSTDVTCFNAKNGTASVTVSGGTPPYTYLWSTFQGSSSIGNLNGGLYIVIVTDNNGCEKRDSADIFEPQPLVATTTVNQITCFNANDGSITVNVTGGTPGYTYAWSNGGTGATLTGLSGGIYEVTVTDTQNCSVVTSAQIINPSQLNINALVRTPKCSGDSNGGIDLIVSGGTPIYSYNWSNGDTLEDLNALASGVYIVTVTDSKGCTAVDTIDVSQPSPLYQTGIITDVTCAGASDGVIINTAYGGTLPYTYAWNDGSVNKDRSNLAGGSYRVTVTDGNGCEATGVYNVIEPLPLVVTLQKTDVVCYGASTGSVSAVVTGGTYPYYYLWSNFEIDSAQTNLTAGKYAVVVTDKNNCRITDSITINQSTQIVIVGTVTDSKCNGVADGSISIAVSGGAGNYTFAWTGGATSQDLQSIAAGVYTVTVTDASGCTSTATFTVGEKTKLSTVMSVSNPICTGGNTGFASVVVTGGAEPYTYSWNATPQQNGATATQLAAGTYIVSITDSYGCIAVDTAVLAQPVPITVTTNVVASKCSNTATGKVTATVTGGNAPYVYVLNNITQASNEFTGLLPGTYTLLVRDANGCEGIATFTINAPNAITVDLVSDKQIILAGMEAQLSAITNSTKNVVSHVWSPLGTFNFNNCADSTNCSDPRVAPLSTTTYTVVVMDEDSCTASDTVTVAVSIVESSFLPTAFSPNGDGLNDRFEFDILGALDAQVKVYDRWGNLIFENDKQTNGIGNGEGWDGTFKGEPVQFDTYVYVMKVRYYNNVEKDFTGTIAVMK